jgi:hypothetical protein
LFYQSIDAEVVSNSIKYTGSLHGVSFAMGGGYHSFWSHFNSNIGVYYSLSYFNTVEATSDQGVKYDQEISNPLLGLGIEGSIGWAF